MKPLNSFHADFSLSVQFRPGTQGDDAKKGKKKKAADLIELPLDEQLPGSSPVDLQKFREEEVNWIATHPSTGKWNNRDIHFVLLEQNDWQRWEGKRTRWRT